MVHALRAIQLQESVCLRGVRKHPLFVLLVHHHNLAEVTVLFVCVAVREIVVFRRVTTMDVAPSERAARTLEAVKSNVYLTKGYVPMSCVKQIQTADLVKSVHLEFVDPNPFSLQPLYVKSVKKTAIAMRAPNVMHIPMVRTAHSLVSQTTFVLRGTAVHPFKIAISVFQTKENAAVRRQQIVIQATHALLLYAKNQVEEYMVMPVQLSANVPKDTPVYRAAMGLKKHASNRAKVPFHQVVMAVLVVAIAATMEHGALESVA